MSQPSKKFPAMITPRGHAAFVWLANKDTKFSEEGVYKVSIVLDKQSLTEGRISSAAGVLQAIPGRDWVRHLLAMCAENNVPSKPGEPACPVRDGDKMTDQNGNAKEAYKGKILLQFKTAYKPDIIDTKGNVLPKHIQVLDGDIIKVKFKPVYREVSGRHYMSTYLDRVMLIEKIAEAKGVEGFGEEDANGYVVPTDMLGADLDAEEVAAAKQPEVAYDDDF